MRVASYARLSLVSQPDTIGAQHQAVEDWIEAGGHELVGRYEDVGKSGRLSAAERPGLSQAIAAVTAGDADAVAVRSLDRLARALHVQEAILAEVWRVGGGVWDVSGDGHEMVKDDPDDPFRTFLRQVLGAAVQLDRSILNKRLQDGRRARRTENGGGRYVGGNPLRYGWRVEPGIGPMRADGTRAAMWVHHEQQWPACRLASKMRDDGHYLREIAAELHRRGYRSSMGRVIGPVAVQHAIHNFKHAPGTHPSMEVLAREFPTKLTKPRLRVVGAMKQGTNDADTIDDGSGSARIETSARSKRVRRHSIERSG